MTTDSDGNVLEVGAMYCCVVRDPEQDQYNELVRYAGMETVYMLGMDGFSECQRDSFVDADTLEECRPDFDYLVRQKAPVIEMAAA